MIAYKGFYQDLTGWGGFRFEPGKLYREKSCKTVRNGFHCTEYALACLQYMTLGRGHRYFQVEAGGEIDEDDWRIAATEMKLLKELTLRELTGYGMMYILQHPKRDDWTLSGNKLSVKRDTAEAEGAGSIAVARGRHPMVKAGKGAICGLILENKTGEITGARVFEAGKEAPADAWLTLNDRGEITNEKKSD